ncbi:MAG: hypothetical protein AAGA56_11030 [Myxococcota bacterium]
MSGEPNSLLRGGQGLMAVGFLAGAFFIVQYPDNIDWTPYAGSFVVAVAGAILIHRGRAQSGTATEKIDSDMDMIEASLTELVAQVEAMNREFDESDPFAYSQQIDDVCMEPINRFVEAREALIHRFDLSVYATVMDQFALGERALNRAWCASADGYVDELQRCLQKAETQLKGALATIRAQSLVLVS